MYEFVDSFLNPAKNDCYVIVTGAKIADQCHQLSEIEATQFTENLHVQAKQPLLC